DGVPVGLAPKAFETLLVLVEGGGKIVERGKIIEEVWPDAFVEEQNLTFNVSVLRKLFTEAGEGERYIETVPKRGYRFIQKVRIIESSTPILTIESHTLTQVISEVQTVDDAFDLQTINGGAFQPLKPAIL